MRHATKGDARVAYDTIRDIDRRGNRDERESVRSPVADLAVARARRERKRRQVDGRDQLAVFEHVVALRLLAG